MVHVKQRKTALSACLKSLPERISFRNYVCCFFFAIRHTPTYYPVCYLLSNLLFGTIQLESGNDRGLLPLKMGSHLECVATVKLRWLRNHNATANDDYDDGDSGLMFRLLNVGLWPTAKKWVSHETWISPSATLQVEIQTYHLLTHTFLFKFRKFCNAPCFSNFPPFSRSSAP